MKKIKEFYNKIYMQLKLAYIFLLATNKNKRRKEYLDFIELNKSRIINDVARQTTDIQYRYMTLEMIDKSIKLDKFYEKYIKIDEEYQNLQKKYIGDCVGHFMTDSDSSGKTYHILKPVEFTQVMCYRSAGYSNEDAFKFAKEDAIKAQTNKFFQTRC